jgi:hypothetical protein
MKTFRFPLCAAVIVVLVVGCKPREKRTHRWEGVDGGAPPDREECRVPALDCADKCYKREASVTCYGCCRDQDALCRMQEKYSFEYCESAR